MKPEEIVRRIMERNPIIIPQMSEEEIEYIKRNSPIMSEPSTVHSSADGDGKNKLKLDSSGYFAYASRYGSER